MIDPSFAHSSFESDDEAEDHDWHSWISSELKLKDGRVIPEKTPCFIRFPYNEEFDLAAGYELHIPSVRPEPFRVSLKKLKKHVVGIHEPELSLLEEWQSDGECETLTGDTVEPDGIGPNGAPSWMLALGLI